MVSPRKPERESKCERAPTGDYGSHHANPGPKPVRIERARVAQTARGRRTLCLLAGIWLLGGIDLCMSALAARHGLLNVDDERNPLAALVLPFGLWALLLYKTVLSTGGSAAFVLYRGRRITEFAAVTILIINAVVVFHWVLFCGYYAPLREASLRLGNFCHAAGQLGFAALLLMLAVLGIAVAHSRRRRPHDFVSACSRRHPPSGTGARRCHNAREPRPIGVRVALKYVLVLALIPLSCSQPRSAPVPAGRSVAGTIFYYDWWDPDGRLWRINADGSDPHPLPAGVRGEPSHRTHDGHRWFLTIREIPGERYPSGRPRTELFAVRDDALSVQLTNQADLEPSPFALRWLMHTEDRVISWVARRRDADGRVADGGLYTAIIVFGPDGRVCGLAKQPRDPVLRFGLVLCPGDEPWWQAPAPDVRNHDWSPDGTSVAYDTTRNELRIADPSTGRTSRITDTPASHPVWSPDGTRIAFKIPRPLGAIASIRCTGADETTVVGCPSGAVFSVADPAWSPNGRYLIYRRVSSARPVEATAEVDLWRVAMDGTGLTNLTADVGGHVTPVAWR